MGKKSVFLGMLTNFRVYLLPRFGDWTPRRMVEKRVANKNSSRQSRNIYFSASLTLHWSDCSLTTRFLLYTLLFPIDEKTLLKNNKRRVFYSTALATIAAGVEICFAAAALAFLELLL